MAGTTVDLKSDLESDFPELPAPALPTFRECFEINGLQIEPVERDENDQRKEPTISEKVALAEAIEARIKGPNGTRQGQRTDLGTCGNISTSDEAGQKTRDIAAKKAGLGSGKTLEAAQRVVERGTPARVEAMDHPTDEPALRGLFVDSFV